MIWRMWGYVFIIGIEKTAKLMLLNRQSLLEAEVHFFKDDLGGDASSDASPAFLSDCERDTECSECHSISLFH